MEGHLLALFTASNMVTLNELKAVLKVTAHEAQSGKVRKI
jgi:hypothetical protein